MPHLMINFIAIVEDTLVTPNFEIDDYAWFSKEEARDKIAKGSLAEQFYALFLKRVEHHEL